MPRDGRSRYELWMTCTDCGDVVVRAELCELQRDPNADTCTMSFPCPDCGRRDTLPVTDADVIDLVAAGFTIRLTHVPAELREWRPCGAPFEWDDLLSFHETLSDAVDVVALATVACRPEVDGPADVSARRAHRVAPRR